jgi:KipI family sensor histidine kinase inhibitor
MTTTWVGDRAMLRRIEGDIAMANRSAIALYRSLNARAFDEVEDVVVGARSVLVMLAPGAEPSDGLQQALHAEIEPDAGPTANRHEIAVRYGGDDGPDLAEVAAAHGISAEDVVRIHSSAIYTVALIGFSPGFPYLLGLDPRIATPRLDSPRVRVPAGSVGIGGTWSGVYPSETPGGWRIIGRCEAALFDAGSDPPALLAPGDTVGFTPTR